MQRRLIRARQRQCSLCGDILVSKSKTDLQTCSCGNTSIIKKNQQKKVLKTNKIQCLKCGDVIESKSTHDFKTCKCGNCSVDGGLAYGRRLGSDYKELSEYYEIVSYLEEINK